MRKLILLALLVLLAAGAFAQAKSGAWLMSAWQASKTDARAAGLFEGFIAGVCSVDARIFFSTPDSVTLEMQVQAVGAWLDAHPQDIEHTADWIVDKALAEHWPAENGLRPIVSEPG